MIQIAVQETDYFLPEDGQQAEACFLELLNNPGETWISAFGFTLQPMFDAIKAADDRGVKIHILLDHTQEVGHAEAPKVKDLIASLKNGDVTVTTAGVNSGKPSQIYHWKGMVVSMLPPGVAGGMTTPVSACWEGSTNFSEGAWYQGNSARVFANQLWAETFVAQQELHTSWARQFEPQYQLTK